jgi:hypothetical protein
MAGSRRQAEEEVQRALHRLKATAERLRGEIEDFANECMPDGSPPTTLCP